jgi:antitoxin ParD1/3/4
MARNTSVTLSDHFSGLVDELVESGRFGSVSEVVREGLRLVEQQEAKLQALRQALIEGEESGSAGPLDMEEIKRTARAMAARAA